MGVQTGRLWMGMRRRRQRRHTEARHQVRVVAMWILCVSGLHGVATAESERDMARVADGQRRTTEERDVLRTSGVGPSGDRVHTPEKLQKYALVERTVLSAVLPVVVRPVRVKSRSGRSLTAVSRQTGQPRWSNLRLELLQRRIAEVLRRPVQRRIATSGNARNHAPRYPFDAEHSEDFQRKP